MNLLNLFKRNKTDSDIFREELDEQKYNYYELYSPELMEWIAATNDPILLACASHLLNCWEWADYLPKPNREYDMEGFGFKTRDYKSIEFTKNLKKQLEDKAEMLSPGLSHNLWMTGYYRKFSTK